MSQDAETGSTRLTGPADAPPFGMVRVAALCPAPALLRERGLDGDAVLRGLGFDVALLADPENVMPFAEMARVLAACASLTGMAHFGLLIGARENLSMFGMVGLMMFNAPTVRAALTALCENFALHNRAATVRLEVDGNLASLHFAAADVAGTGAEQMLDLGMAVAVTLIARLCGAGWRPVEVQLPRPRPQDPRPYRTILGASVRFGAPVAAVVFDAAFLDRPVAGADPVVHGFISARVAAIRAGLSLDPVGEIRRMMPVLRADGRPGIEDLAAAFGISARTLRRRLHARGVRLPQMRDEAAYDLARRLLAGTDLSTTEISDRLGYAHPSGFSRAFARWSGMSPRTWRQQALRPGAAPARPT